MFKMVIYNHKEKELAKLPQNWPRNKQIPKEPFCQQNFITTMFTILDLFLYLWAVILTVTILTVHYDVYKILDSVYPTIQQKESKQEWYCLGGVPYLSVGCTYD
jgi:hypothetical protein